MLEFEHLASRKWLEIIKEEATVYRRQKVARIAVMQNTVRLPHMEQNLQQYLDMIMNWISPFPTLQGLSLEGE